MKKKALTVALLRKEAKAFADAESNHQEPALYGVTDGKAVGTYLEHKFLGMLDRSYTYVRGNSAEGIDFPQLLVDIKVTSIKQPQSSCPYKAARQKVYGLGYSLLVFVYEKTDNPASASSTLKILHVVLVKAERTADYQMTTGISALLRNKANEDDVAAFLLDRNLPVDDIQANQLAREIVENPPLVGCLTISNALQWRLQYKRAIEQAGRMSGVWRVK